MVLWILLQVAQVASVPCSASKHACEGSVTGVGVARQVKVQPHETLFRVGDSSEAGIFIVVEGRLGVFLQVRLRLASGSGHNLRDVPF